MRSILIACLILAAQLKVAGVAEADFTLETTRVDKITSSSTCANATKKYDRDIQKNINALSHACIQRYTIKDGGRTWKVYTISNGRAGPLWAVLHDNENAAFNASVAAMNDLGGTIVAVEAREKRKFQGKDPNRNFGTKCGDARNYTKFMMDLAHRSGRVIAMHTNSAGYSGDGGSGHINIYRKSKVLIGYPAKGAKGAYKSGDNFILIPGKGNIGSDAESKVRKLHKKGIHAMYERVTKAGNDCSMSNHVVLNTRIPYYNVEVQHGQTRTAKALAKVANSL